MAEDVAAFASVDNITDEQLYEMLEKTNCTCAQDLSSIEQEAGAISAACEFHGYEFGYVIEAARETMRSVAEATGGELLKATEDEFRQLFKA